MTAVVPRVGLACGGAFSGVVDAGEVLDAYVGVLACGVERGVDGAAECGGAVEAGLGVRRVVLGVAVGAGDDDLEFSAPLAGVDGGFGGDAGAPEGAFDVGEGGWVGAGVTWVEGRVALVVDVEGGAEVGGVTELLAFDRVVGLERVETHVAVGVDCGLEVHKGPLVALGCWGVVGSILVIC